MKENPKLEFLFKFGISNLGLIFQCKTFRDQQKLHPK